MQNLNIDINQLLDSKKSDRHSIDDMGEDEGDLLNQSFYRVNKSGEKIIEFDGMKMLNDDGNELFKDKPEKKVFTDIIKSGIIQKTFFDEEKIPIYMEKELQMMPQKCDSSTTKTETPINFKKQSDIIKKNIHLAIAEPDIEKIKQNDFAPELRPDIQRPKEVQELRHIYYADNKDI